MRKFLVFGSLISLLAPGCSVQRGSVPNNPPVIEKPDIKQMKFEVEYGVMKPEVISAVMWPQSWTEKETEERVYIINRNSIRIDELFVEKMTNPVRIEALYKQFVGARCVVDFRKPAPADQPAKAPEEHIEAEDVDWIDVSSISPDRVVDLEKCKSNQTARREIRRRDDEIFKVDFPKLTSEIDAAIGIENKVSVSTTGSVLRFPRPIDNAPRTVEISLRDFNGSGLTQKSFKPADSKKKEDLKAKIKALKSEAAGLQGDELANKESQISKSLDALKEYAKFIQDTSIDADGRRLLFKVPDLKSSLKQIETASGIEFAYSTIYEFDFSRVENLLSVPETEANDRADIAKFKGDIVQVNDGVDVRKGSGQLMGPFVATK